ncbi:MAG: hypothetical protein QM802_11665 [Agriterribacter sp.]
MPLTNEDSEYVDDKTRTSWEWILDNRLNILISIGTGLLLLFVFYKIGWSS